MIIEITDVPPGAAPDWVRQTWVGMQLKAVQSTPVTMPTVSMRGGQKSKLSIIWNMLSGQATTRTGYIVNARDAIGLMALKNEEAAQWCIDNTPLALDPKQVLLFEQSCCRLIAGH